MDDFETLESGMGPWLSPEELEFVRHKVPMVYVNVVPVQLAPNGKVEAIGLLLHVSEDSIVRSIISGRVLFHESLHDAVIRHLEKDLGLMALPTLPVSMTPFTVAEYFPTPGEGLVDPRQHAVAMGYVIPMAGDCSPSNDALEFTWFSPDDILTPELLAELTPGHDVMIKRALAYLGYASRRF